MQHSIVSPTAVSPASSDRAARRRGAAFRLPRRAVLPAAICASLALPVHAQGPYTESFDDQALRDAAATRASWGETTAGRLELATSQPLAAVFSASTPATDLPGAFTTRSLALGDLDGDGDLDLAEGATPRSGVYLWNGAGAPPGFGARTQLEASSANTRGIAIGDVDADGDLDIVAGNLNQRPRMFLNSGDGVAFTGQDISPEARRTDHISLVDFDRDGFLDVVTANQANFANAIYLNTGNPLQPFGPRGVPAIDISNARDNTQQLAWGDVDNDGDIDFVALNENQVNKLHGQRDDGTFSNTQIGNEADDSQAGALGDLNGDGFLDLVVINSMPGQVSKIYLNTGDPTKDSPARFQVPGLPFTEVANPDHGHSVRLADADNDGDLDIFMSTAGPFVGTQTNRLYLNDGSGMVFTAVVIGSALDITNTAAVGDVDNDGRLDYVAGNESRDANNVALGAVNRLYLNEGMPGGAAVPQLRGVATSLQVNPESNAVASVRLRVSPADLGPNNEVAFWVSSNGGLAWVHATPNRPVAIPPARQGTDLRWRAVVSSRSPSAINGAAFFGVDDVSLELNTSGPSRAAPIGEQSATQGTAFGPLDASYTDADGDAVFHALTGLPPDSGIGIDPRTGEIGGTPTNSDAMASPIAVTLTATDGALQAQETFTITVANVNDAPAFTSAAPTTATGGTAYGYAVTVVDPDAGDVVTLAAPAVPAWLTFTDDGGGSGTLSGTPTDADVGDHSVSLLASDAQGATAQQDFVITVAASGANGPPTITSSPPTTASEGTEYVYAITATDPNGDAMTISAPTRPAWLELRDNGDGTGELRGTPTASDVGSHAVALQVADAHGAVTPQSFAIAVEAASGGPVPNQSPTITLNGDATVMLQVGAAFTDPGATAADPEDGDLTGQITVDNPVNTGVAGTYTVTYSVEDSTGETAQVERTVVVQAPATQNPNPPQPTNPQTGGGGGGGGGAAGLWELLGLALLALARLRRARSAHGSASESRCM